MMKRFLVFASLLLLSSALLHAQDVDSTIHVKAFFNPQTARDVGTMVSRAMATCPNTATPCILVIDPSLASYAPGTLPPLCPNCTLADYRHGVVTGSGPGLPSNYTLVNCWGDSLVVGVGDTANLGGFCGRLAAALGFSSNNQGVGGQGSPQIFGRLGSDPVTVTVVGGVIPTGPNCTVQITYNTGYEVAFNANTASPSLSAAPAPYNNFNGSTVGGQWGTIAGVQGQSVDGVWNGTSWNYTGTYYFTPQTCPASPVTVPPNSPYTPLLFDWLNGMNLLEGGHNNVTGTGGVAQTESDFDKGILYLPGATGKKRIILIPVMYSSNWQTGSAEANSVAAVNSYLASNYAPYWPVVGSQNMLQYLGSLYDPTNPVDVYDHAQNPLLVPSSLRAFYPVAGTLTSAISDNSTCSFSLSSTTPYQYITVDSEKILIQGMSGNNVTTCGRGAFSTTAATHSNGANYGGEDRVHLNSAGYAAGEAFLKSWVDLQASALLGDYLNAYSYGKLNSNPNPNIYALPNYANFFRANQTVGPISDASAGTPTVSSRYRLFQASAYDSSTGLVKAIQIGVNLVALSPTSYSLVFTPFSGGTAGYVFTNGGVTLLNNVPATSGGNQPAAPITFSGPCWDGSASQAEQMTVTPVSSAGTFGINIAGTSNCGNVFKLWANGVSVTPPDPLGTTWAGWRDDFLSSGVSTSTTVTAVTLALFGETPWMLRPIGGVPDIGYNVGSNASLPNHAGTFNFSTNAGSPVSGYGVVLAKDFNGSSTSLLPSSSVFDVRFIFQSGQSANEKLRIGFAVPPSTTIPPTYGFWLRLDTSLGDTNYTFEMVKNGVNTGTVTATSVAADSGVWHDLEIKSTAIGTVQFILDGGTPVVYSTNVPTVGLAAFAQLITTTTSNVNMTLDLAGMSVPTGIVK